MTGTPATASITGMLTDEPQRSEGQEASSSSWEPAPSLPDGQSRTSSVSPATCHEHQSQAPETAQDDMMGGPLITADTFTPHDVVLGKGNGINSLPGNLQFRKIIVKYKPLYASTPRSLKGSVAELVINEIACLGGKFLEPQSDQRFCEVSKKRAIEKTCQALREKKNNNGRPQQVSPDHDNQLHHYQHHQQQYPPHVLLDSIQREQQAAVPTQIHVVNGADETDTDNTSQNDKQVVSIMENDVLYGGRGRRHFHRVANQRFLELVKVSRKEYHESRSKKSVARRIVKEWQSQQPPGRFLQQDPTTEKWYEIKESKIMEKTCQALRDLKRERGPAGVKQGISERMVDPWEKAMPYPMRPPINGSNNMQPSVHGQPMLGQVMPPHQGHHPYHHPGWIGQPMYPPQMMQGGMIAPYMQAHPPQSSMNMPSNGVPPGPPLNHPLLHPQHNAPPHANAMAMYGAPSAGEKANNAINEESKVKKESTTKPVSPAIGVEVPDQCNTSLERRTTGTCSAALTAPITTLPPQPSVPPTQMVVTTSPVEDNSSQAAQSEITIAPPHLPPNSVLPPPIHESATNAPFPANPSHFTGLNKSPPGSNSKNGNAFISTPVEGMAETPACVEDNSKGGSNKSSDAREKANDKLEECLGGTIECIDKVKEDQRRREGQDTAKDDNRKKGELEAAALLANMFSKKSES